MKIKGDILNLYILPPNETDIPAEIPNEESQCFVMQGTNLFKFRKTPVYSILSSVEKSEEILKDFFKEKECLDVNTLYAIGGTNLTDGILEYSFPHEEFARAITYFEWVYDNYKTEAAVLLLVNHDLKEWKVFHVLNTDTSGVSVKYLHPDSSVYIKDPKAKAAQEKVVENYNKLYDEGWRVYGTIHSHCDFNAFHSGVDDADEMNFEGLHITIGNLKSGYTYAARFMLESVPLELYILDILDDDSTKGVENLSKSIVLSDEQKGLFFKNPAKPQISTGNSAKYKDNVFEDDEIIVVQHNKTNEILFVKSDYYEENKKTFFRNYTEISIFDEVDMDNSDDDEKYFHTLNDFGGWGKAKKLNG